MSPSVVLSLLIQYIWCWLLTIFSLRAQPSTWRPHAPAHANHRLIGIPFLEIWALWKCGGSCYVDQEIGIFGFAAMLLLSSPRTSKTRYRPWPLEFAKVLPVTLGWTGSRHWWDYAELIVSKSLRYIIDSSSTGVIIPFDCLFWMGINHIPRRG